LPHTEPGSLRGGLLARVPATAVLRPIQGLADADHPGRCISVVGAEAVSHRPAVAVLARGLAARGINLAGMCPGRWLPPCRRCTPCPLGWCLLPALGSVDTAEAARPRTDRESGHQAYVPAALLSQLEPLLKVRDAAQKGRQAHRRGALDHDWQPADAFTAAECQNDFSAASDDAD
jgi:hypothetical protein